MNFYSYCDAILVESNMEAIHFDTKDTAAFVAWIYKTNPTLVREVVCAECDLHIKGTSKVERGK